MFRDIGGLFVAIGVLIILFDGDPNIADHLREITYQYLMQMQGE